MKKKVHFFYQSKIHLILYVLLLITTPFLLLQNYLQTSIGKLSELSFQLGKIHIPYVLLIALIFTLFIIIVFRKKITFTRISAILVIVLLWIIGQKVSDYYFNHKFYELQHNWHYIAYGIYSYIMYRFLKSINLPVEKIFIYTYLVAIACSTFDEIIQIYISGRIFDIGDIGKDVWGTVLGIVFISFVLQQGKIFYENKKIRFKKIKEYFKNPFAILFYEVIYTIIFLTTSSLFTEVKYLKYAILISISLCFMVFLIIHLTQFKKSRMIILSFLALVILIQGISFIKYHKQDIIFYNQRLIVYKGLVIPYFDVMIYSNGTFRFVDKKAYFNERDKNKIFHQEFDILLIGTGLDGTGGLGFDDRSEIQFAYNKVSDSPFQLLLLKNSKAFKEFNRLKKEGFNVLFIIHNI